MRFPTSVTVVVLVSAMSVGTAAAQNRLPFPDGTYVTSPQMCRLTAEAMMTQYGDRIGAMVRHIEGRKLDNGYEMQCEIRSVSLQGNAVRFRAMCEKEGETEAVNGSWVRIDDRSFRIGNRTFTSCGRLIRH